VCPIELESKRTTDGTAAGESEYAIFIQGAEVYMFASAVAANLAPRRLPMTPVNSASAMPPHALQTVHPGAANFIFSRRPTASRTA